MLHLVYYSRVYMWSIVGCVSVAYSIVFLCLWYSIGFICGVLLLFICGVLLLFMLSLLVLLIV